MTAVSVFKTISQDESAGAGRGRVVDTTRDQGVVVYRSNFAAGFDGWTDHWSGFRPLPLVSLTTEMQLRGARSLMLSTGEGAYVSGAWENNAAVWKRLGLYQSYRFHSYSGYLAVGNGGYSSPWASFELTLDFQKFDNSSRSLYHLRCATQPSPDFSRWELTDDAGATVVIPASTHVVLGDNENKQGMNYVRLTVDTLANGGAGGYYQAQVNQQVFDLTGLGAGHGSNAIQGGTGNAIDDYNGGANLGLTLARSTQSGGCQLFADDLVYSVSNTWAS